MSKVVNPIIGSKFEKLTIVEVVDPVIYKCGTVKKRVRCECECGGSIVCIFASILNGHTKSCGCLKEPVKRKAVALGIYDKFSYKKIWQVWEAMKERCISHKDYHGRGITVEKKWRDDFIVFYKWAIENGWRDGLEIDRRDNDGNYEPNNCRFVTPLVNSRNKRNTVKLLYSGESKSIGEWGDIFGISYRLISSRLSQHWSVKDALELPVGADRREWTIPRIPRPGGERVIDTRSGKIYVSVENCCAELGHAPTTLRRKLYGKRPNDTTIRLIKRQ